MLKEHDIIVLNEDIPDHGLKKDDVGAVVAVYVKGKGYEVEFITYKGDTIAVVTLLHYQVRPIAAKEMMTVRNLVNV